MSELRSIDDLFGELIELRDPAEKKAFLDHIGGTDPEIYDQLRRLLAAHDQAGSFLETAGQATMEFEGAEYVGKQIRQYKLRELVGEGGMGAVYVAEQEKPLRRKVALKVIKPGMDSKAVLARFDAERNALALMNHPNIAKVLDAGTTSEGRPFFVMELVRGQTITEYCDAQKLTIRERLNLFIEVCQAIQHAHQKGIIHRDIKPSNVLVTELDGKPVAKVIDFGVAKALNQSLTEQSIYTAHQAVIGTPLYMSPEQASFSAVDVDTRSDVYSLGVLLYELLTGTTPFTREDLQQAAQEEVFKLIREREPPRPSNRISSLGDTATRISQLRRTQPDQLGRTVKGDLDWIVMKALSKERVRRYDSATRFSQDVNRYLNDDIVEARPPTLGYQLQKFYARNRQMATLVGVLAVAMLAVIGVLAWSSASLKYANDKLSENEKELKEKNDELVDSGFARVFELAQTGRLDEAREKLDVLADSSSDERRRRLYGDIVNLFGSEEERRQARDDLIELDREHGDVLVKSMLVLSYIRTGDEWSYHDRVAELFDLPATTYEEYLFRGAAFIFAHPVNSRADLEHAVRLNPESSVAHILLSQALQSFAMERELRDEELLRLAKECQTEAIVGSRTSSPDNINAIIASLDAHCTLFLSLKQSAAAQEMVDDCIRSWQGELSKSFKLKYDAQLHRAWLDSYRILLRYGSPLAEKIQEDVMRDPQACSDGAEVAIKLIQLHLLKRDDGKALRLAESHLEYIRDYDLMAILPLLSSRYRDHGLDATRAFTLEVLSKQKPHPVASTLNWKVLTLLGEHEKATLEAQKFRDYCHDRPQDPRAHDALIVANWMANPMQHSIASSDIAGSTYGNHFRILHHFNEAMHLYAIGNRGEAVWRMEATRDSSAFRPFINAWAEVFLERRDDPDFLPWLDRSRLEGHD